MSDWIPVGSLADIPQRGARCVATPHGRIGIFRTADDRVFALQDHCPHRGGPLQYGKDRGFAQVVTTLEGLAREHGPRFEPCVALRRLAAGEQGRFDSLAPRGSIYGKPMFLGGETCCKI